VMDELGSYYHEGRPTQFGGKKVRRNERRKHRLTLRGRIIATATFLQQRTHVRIGMHHDRDRGDGGRATKTYIDSSKIQKVGVGGGWMITSALNE